MPLAVAAEEAWVGVEGGLPWEQWASEEEGAGQWGGAGQQVGAGGQQLALVLEEGEGEVQQQQQQGRQA